MVDLSVEMYAYMSFHYYRKTGDFEIKFKTLSVSGNEELTEQRVFDFVPFAWLL